MFFLLISVTYSPPTPPQYTLPFYTIEFRPPGKAGTAPFVVDCYVGYAIATETDGARACSKWSFENACVRLLFDVNKGVCGDEPQYAAVGSDLGRYTEDVDFYTMMETSFLLVTLVVLWMFYFLRRWVPWFLLLLKAMLGTALATSVMVYVATMRAMNELKTGANTFAGQDVYWGWGFVVAVSCPLVALVVHTTLPLYVS
jgi:hypothetical protein